MPTARHLLPILLFTATALVLSACGGGSASTGGPGNGAIEVQHRADSPGIVDRFVIREQFGPRTFEVDSDLAPGESFTVTELLPGPHDVDVEWTDGGMTTYMDVVVQAGQTTEVVVGR